jgi:hypothetical protein
MKKIKTKKVYSDEKYGFKTAMEKAITFKRPLRSYYQDEDGVAYYEGCDCLGYMENGDSFLFSQGMGFGKGKDKRVIFCISRNFLERTLRDYPLSMK